MHHADLYLQAVEEKKNIAGWGAQGGLGGQTLCFRGGKMTVTAVGCCCFALLLKVFVLLGHSRYHYCGVAKQCLMS